MLKSTVFLFIVICIQISALVAQDTPKILQSSEPNITEPSPKTGDDVNGTTADPNITYQAKQILTADVNSSKPDVTQPPLKPPTENDINSIETRTGSDGKAEPVEAANRKSFDWKMIIGLPSAIVAIIVIINHLRGFIRRSEKRYKKSLINRLGRIQLGMPDIPNMPVHLLDTFVSLRISTMKGELETHVNMKSQDIHEDCTPQQIIQRAFTNSRRILLILGEAGSGKTTLLSYYAMCCLYARRHKELGLGKRMLPIYFPLREVKFSDKGYPLPLARNLAMYAEESSVNITKDKFISWLNKPNTLVLLDGLDEISDTIQRGRVCQWIDETANNLDKAKFVITCRWTGYGKKVGVELGSVHLCANMMDFSPEQREEFLQKWFIAAFLEEPRDTDIGRRKWRTRQRQLGLKQAQAVIDFLGKEENKGLQGLAGVPMLLQIMAIIWKDRQNLPKAKSELYEAALKYMLEHRPRKKHLDYLLLLPAKDAIEVLAPVSLWMQEKKTEEVEKDAFHIQIQPTINAINDRLKAEKFCKNLVDRAAVLADCGDSSYIFRHKSFREYLAGLQLKKVAREPNCMKEVIKHFGDDWWDEPLCFFMGEADAEIFDGFMSALFKSKVSDELNQKQQNLLKILIGEARQIQVTSMVQQLNNADVSNVKKRYILDCLKVIDREEARVAVREFAAKNASTTVGAYAQEIASEAASEEITLQDAAKVVISSKLSLSFHNNYEYNAEYIHITGGQYTYSVTKKTETVPDIYFAKYPVTNKRYRRFISYLQDKEPNLAGILPNREFDRRMIESVSRIEGFGEYLDSGANSWPDKLRSVQDTEKRFNGDDQPVVGVSWFAAWAYCFWLSALEEAGRDSASGGTVWLYRLPTELEWEWAAGGGIREYPWAPEKGPPTDKLANYDSNVGATTPVGRYPDGATPEGLMDMAGNVWEWVENWYDEDKDARSLRGGSWYDYESDLRCSGRYYFYPDARVSSLGFRVVRSQS